VTTGAVVGTPRAILRLEGAALALSAVFFFWHSHGSWLLFAVLILAPDLSFFAYLISPPIGAIAYNLVHSTIGPLVLLAAAVWFGCPRGESIALIWLTHVGIDRALGYGLKYQTAFGDTHLGHIGR